MSLGVSVFLLSFLGNEISIVIEISVLIAYKQRIYLAGACLGPRSIDLFLSIHEVHSICCVGCVYDFFLRMIR